MPSLRSASGTHSGTASVPSMTRVIPTGTPIGSRAYIIAGWNINNSALAVSGGEGGWEAEALQSPNTIISARVFRKDIEAGDIGQTITVTSPAGSGRAAIALVIVDKVNPGAGAFTAPVFSSSGSNTSGVTSHVLPASEDPARAALKLCMVIHNIAAGSGGITPPASGWTEQVDQITTNGTGRRLGVWVATANAIDDTATPATTYSSGAQNSVDLTWVFTVQDPPVKVWNGGAEVPAAVTFWNGTAEVPATELSVA